MATLHPKKVHLVRLRVFPSEVLLLCRFGVLLVVIAIRFLELLLILVALLPSLVILVDLLIDVVIEFLVVV